MGEIDARGTNDMFPPLVKDGSSGGREQPPGRSTKGARDECRGVTTATARQADQGEGVRFERPLTSCPEESSASKNFNRGLSWGRIRQDELGRGNQSDLGEPGEVLDPSLCAARSTRRPRRERFGRCRQHASRRGINTGGSRPT